MPPIASLEGLTILIVEDDPFIAMDIAHTIKRAGAEVAGPFATVSLALNRIGEERPDGAVLDVDLGQETCLPVADELVSLGVPFVFHTGQSFDLINIESYDAPVIRKPTPAPRLIDQFAELMRSRSNGSATAEQ